MKQSKGLYTNYTDFYFQRYALYTLDIFAYSIGIKYILIFDNFET